MFKGVHRAHRSRETGAVRPIIGDRAVAVDPQHVPILADIHAFDSLFIDDTLADLDSDEIVPLDAEGDAQGDALPVEKDVDETFERVGINDLIESVGGFDEGVFEGDAPLPVERRVVIGERIPRHDADRPCSERSVEERELAALDLVH